ncbi:MAG: hypothetical protein J7K21_04390, partial [Desulfurococcales archaeon]|nr:hypothetical protein [Desulfurococcales archaeon]
MYYFNVFLCYYLLRIIMYTSIIIANSITPPIAVYILVSIPLGGGLVVVGLVVVGLVVGDVVGLVVVVGDVVGEVVVTELVVDGEV